MNAYYIPAHGLAIILHFLLCSNVVDILIIPILCEWKLGAQSHRASDKSSTPKA